MPATAMVLKQFLAMFSAARARRHRLTKHFSNVLGDNICCLIQSMYARGLKPKFYAQAA
jgi:hypothetical protein